jgi:hypothetical protein
MNKFANELFTLLRFHLLPEPNCLPNNFYVAKTLTCQLGLDRKTIHACARGCVLFRGQHQNVVHYPKCGGPRYKHEVNKMFLVKVLRHFPIVPKLQRRYKSPTLSQLMLCHSQNCSLDGMVRHPCDSKVWKHVHDLYLNLATKPRNVHLTLLVDGVNLFKLSCSIWCAWPILLLNYNIPPMVNNKKKFFILLSKLIPGK